MLFPERGEVARPEARGKGPWWALRKLGFASCCPARPFLRSDAVAFVAEIRARSYDLQSLLHLGLGNGTALRRQSVGIKIAVTTVRSARSVPLVRCLGQGGLCAKIIGKGRPFEHMSARGPECQKSERCVGQITGIRAKGS